MTEHSLDHPSSKGGRNSPIPQETKAVERNIKDEVRMIEAYVQGEQGQQGEEPEEEIYHVYDVPGGVVILREGEIPGAHSATVIDSEPPETEPQTNIPATALPGKPPTAAYLTISAYLFLILSCLMFQIYALINPFTVSVTLAAKSEQVTATGTLQLGRELNPITVSQSATANTTGKGHQDAKEATGTVTFYNGSNVAQTINAGTVLTGSDSVQVVTDQTITVPADNPPVNGQATLSAHAINTGSAGNIQALDINGTVSSSLFVKNLNAFTGGQDERNFQMVAKTDITNAQAMLQASVTQGSNAALQGQLKTHESLVTPSCTTTTTSNHQPGEEATHVTVTVSETCSSVAYNQDTLQTKVLQLLTIQAAKKLETGYSLLGNPEIAVTRATAQKNIVTVTFKAQSMWIYALTSAEQKHIKTIIAGKTKEKAMQLLSSLPSIERVSLQTSGFGDDTRIPKDQRYIHLLLIYEPV